ncbi:cytochrome b/b6 domain-containing protein [Aliamphritea spongicola]
MQAVRRPALQTFWSPAADYSLLSGLTVNFTGHNPAGGLMVLLMISLLLLQAMSGLLTSELSDSESLLGRGITGWLELLHEVIPPALTGLVTMHLTAIIIYKYKGQPLVRAMINGYADSTDKQPLLQSNRRAAFVLFISTVLLTSLITVLIFLTY